MNDCVLSRDVINVTCHSHKKALGRFDGTPSCLPSGQQ